MSKDTLALSEILLAMRDILKGVGIADPVREARYLAESITESGWCRSDMRISQGRARSLLALAERRACGEPVSRIRGWRDFWTHRFVIDDAVLDPRPESETVVEAVCDFVPEGTDAVVWDMGCGSGCLLASILSERPGWVGIGVDVSFSALELARLNLRRVCVAERWMLVAADWYCGLGGRADVIVSNPPYIASDQIASVAVEVRLFDPHIALDGGRDGLDAYRILSAGAIGRLTPAGVLIVEVGSGQAESVVSIFTSAGLCDIRQWSDAGGAMRVVAGRSPC